MAPKEARHLPPNPKRLVKMLGSVGHTLPSAVADIVDNAISKDATDIRITFGRPDDGHGRWMTITDNGTGMDEGTGEAMRIGSDTHYEAEDLGKYGYGLKGASWSQTRLFHRGQPASGKARITCPGMLLACTRGRPRTTPLSLGCERSPRSAIMGRGVSGGHASSARRCRQSGGWIPTRRSSRNLSGISAWSSTASSKARQRGERRSASPIGGRRFRPNNPVGHA